MEIVISGEKLTIEEVVAVARGGAKVRIAEQAQKKVVACREYVDRKLAEGAVVYGLTTGFGKFSDTLISAEDTRALQRNLIISHCLRHGRAAAVARWCAPPCCCGATPCRSGNSGIRLSTLETLLSYAQRRRAPRHPGKGLAWAPAATWLLCPIWCWSCWAKATPSTRVQVMPERRGDGKGRHSRRLSWRPRKGLALINGTQIMTAIGCMVVS